MASVFRDRFVMGLELRHYNFLRSVGGRWRLFPSSSKDCLTLETPQWRNPFQTEI